MLYMPIGPPGCRKSSLGKLMVQADILTADCIVSSDFYRWVLTGGQQDQSCTPEAFRIVDRIVDYRLRGGLDVYLDATNLTKSSRNTLVWLAAGYKQPVTFLLSTLSEEVIRRGNNSTERQELKTVVPDQAMEKMFNKFRAVDLSEFESRPTEFIVTTIEDMTEVAEDLLFDKLHGI